jgi:hypothetical protein
MGYGQEGKAIFVVGDDPGHPFTRRASLGLIELHLAGRYGVRILCLQQLRATGNLALCHRHPQQRSSYRADGTSCENSQPQSPQIE